MDPPSLNPINPKVNKGDTIHFSCFSNGSAEIIYEWKFKGRIISSDSSIKMTDIDTSYAGIYECSVTMNKLIKTAATRMEVYCKFTFF